LILRGITTRCKTIFVANDKDFVIAWLRRNLRGYRNFIQPDPAVTGAANRQKAQAEALQPVEVERREIPLREPLGETEEPASRAGDGGHLCASGWEKAKTRSAAVNAA
jgi:hypothetical protein